jgi:D-galactarolactone cycloisomerase
MPRRCTIITRVVTEEGIVGEAYNADADEEQPVIMRVIRDELAPMLVGRDALAYEQCWELMRRITFDQLRDRRFAMQAIACIDSAIWDATGKAVQMPLYRLWGGFRDALPMIGIGGYYTNDPADLEEDVGFFSNGGFVGMKFKIGGRSPAEDAERLARAVKTAREGFAVVRHGVASTVLSSENVFWEPATWDDNHRGRPLTTTPSEPPGCR